MLAARGMMDREVLEVRIPVACAGLDLGWAILQCKGSLEVDALDKLSAGAICRLVLQSAGVPVAIPNEFGALAARKGRIGQRDWAVPRCCSTFATSSSIPRSDLTCPSGQNLTSWISRGNWPPVSGTCRATSPRVRRPLPVTMA